MLIDTPSHDMSCLYDISWGIMVRDGLIGAFLAAIYVLLRGCLMPIFCRRDRKVLG